jgi:NAD(P)-dependent dehydrogenase (short-subunit alcohol dehydrogenase family)
MLSAYDSLFSLANRVAVVTGGAGDIAAVILKSLLDVGATAVSIDAAPVIDSRLQDLGVPHYLCDIRDEAQIRETFDSIVAKFDRIDVLVNAAGVIERGSILDHDAEKIDRVMSVNIAGSLLCSREAGRHMTARKYGRIVNFASTNGEAGVKNCVAYCASKGAVIAMTKAMAAEWAEFNVTVNAISPNVVKTRMTADRLSDSAEEQKSISRIPLGRLLTPQDLVGGVIFLASDAAAMVTGHVLNIDGGYMAV